MGEPEAKADPWYTTYGYGLHAPLAYGYGYPSVYSGYHYYGKRSADAEPKAEADPYVVYSGLGYAGHYGYAGYGHYYGKRSADAEPKADAYYGYYGYARPYGGYYGYAPLRIRLLRLNAPRTSEAQPDGETN